MSHFKAGPIQPGDLVLGNLEIRMAERKEEIEAVQALRYRIFYVEMSAKPTADMYKKERDFDDFDDFCDHLLILDHRLGDKPEESIVGTYRLLRRSAVPQDKSFYSSGEYNISNLLHQPGELLELGRSCVDAAYRTRPTMYLLWSGIAAYVFYYDIQLMFGCASIPEVDVQVLSLPLSYLYFYHLAPDYLRTTALQDRHIEMRRMEKHLIEPKQALATLPPLIKGYLRLGGFVGDGAVFDPQFHTTDVCMIVRTDLVTKKYYRHYEQRHRRPINSI